MISHMLVRSSGQSYLVLLLIASVVAFFVGTALWRAWATWRVGRAAKAATPAIEKLESVVAAFHARFPPLDSARLPLEPDEYPAPKPRKPSPPRPTASSRRRRSYPRRHR